MADLTREQIADAVLNTRWESGEPVRNLTRMTAEMIADSVLAASAAAKEAERVANQLCDAEVDSWSIFDVNTTDRYWIRCTKVGPHTEHEDSNTGAKWSDS